MFVASRKTLLLRKKMLTLRIPRAKRLEHGAHIGATRPRIQGNVDDRLRSVRISITIRCFQGVVACIVCWKSLQNASGRVGTAPNQPGANVSILQASPFRRRHCGIHIRGVLQLLGRQRKGGQQRRGGRRGRVWRRHSAQPLLRPLLVSVDTKPGQPLLAT